MGVFGARRKSGSGIPAGTDFVRNPSSRVARFRFMPETERVPGPYIQGSVGIFSPVFFFLRNETLNKIL
jgi:hypothetical protein